MSIPFRYVFQQGATIAALHRGAFGSVLPRKKGPVTTPGPKLSAVLPARTSDLLDAYVRHVGGDPAAYRGTVPAHLFPQWSFAFAARALEDLPYPLVRVLNGGCRVEIAKPLPANEPLDVKVWLEDVNDDGRRVVIHEKIVTGTRSAPEGYVADLYAIVPLRRSGPKPSGASGEAAPRKKEDAIVPSEARELERWSLAANAGLDFAKLTGDVNPIHWLRPYARAFGFKSTILHGYSTMARAWEGVVKHVLGGDPLAMRAFDTRFTKPLVLPASVGLYVVPKGENAGDVFVGDAVGSPPYLTGSFAGAK